MNSRSKSLAAASAFLCAVSMAAQTADTSQPSVPCMSLQDCIDYALQNNLDLQQKIVAVDITDVDIDAREGALFPSLSFATNQNASWRPWSKSYVNITDGSMASTTSTVNYNGTYGLQAQWTVWDGGKTRKQLQQSRVSKQRAETDAESTRLSLMEQIVQYYVQILYQDEAVNVCAQILESTRTQLRRAQEMYEIGSLSKADLAQMQAQVSQEDYNLANARTQLAQFKMQLRQILRMPPAYEFSVSQPDVDQQAVLAELPDLDAVCAAAAASRPEIRYNRLGIEIADLDIDIARRGYYPSISLQAGINTSASSGLDINWASQIKTNLSNSLGFTISVPIFDRRQNSTNVARARLDRENAVIALEQQIQQLRNSIETIWLNLDNAREQYRYALSSLNSMRESYTLVSEQFAVGLKDIVDLTTSKNNLVQAEQQALQTKYTAVLNRALLNFYNGENLSL